MKRLAACLFLICLFFCGSAVAENMKIGVASYYAVLDVSDPDGDTESFAGMQPYNLVFAMPLSNSTRFFVEAGLVDFELDGSGTKIANDVSGYRLAAAYQLKIRALRNLHFWVGAGPEIAQLDFNSRFTVAVDGFLRERFEDRSETTLAGYANVTSEWAVSDKFDVGLNVSYKYAFGDSVSGLNAGLIFLYKFGDE